MNQLIEKIKQNLSVILLLPAIIGGFWQLLELSKMSISFIRFFSPTQLLPDGLLILFLMMILYLAYKLGSLKKKEKLQRKIIIIDDKAPFDFTHRYIKLNKMSKLKFVDNPIYEKSRINYHVMSIFFGIILIGIMFYMYIHENGFHFITLAAFLTALILFGRPTFASFFVLHIHLIESRFFNVIKQYCSDKEWLNFFIKLFVLLLVIIIFIRAIVFLLFILSFFHQKYFLPENLKNLEYIQNTLQDKEYNTSRISYFNDRYIFIEHNNGDKNTTIEILKFEELFKKKYTPCE